MKRTLVVAAATLGLAFGCSSNTGAPGGHVDAATGGGPHDAALADSAAPADDLAGGGGDLASDDGGVSDDGGATDDGGLVDDGATGDLAPGGSDASGGGAPDLAPYGFTTVFTILLENTSYSSVIGKSYAPYINQLATTYGLARNYSDSGTHPSLPNYLYLVSGNTQYPGLLDLSPTNPFYFPADAENLGHQLTTAKIPWRAYMQSMQQQCNLSNNGNYAPKHNPFVYFSDIQKSPTVCADVDVDYDTNFAIDLAQGHYRYMWISPDLAHDGHDPANDRPTAIGAADAWCASEIPKILASQAFQQGGVLFLTFDEGDSSTGDQVAMIVISPRTPKGYTSMKKYSHADYLATVEDIFHLPRLGAAQGATGLMEFLP